MKIQHLFCKEECIAIEDKYGSHIIYRAFRSPCLTIANESKTFSLHPSDLFYQCFYAIDELKSKSSGEQLGYCKYELRADLYAHILEKTENVDAGELELAVCMIMQVVAEWLIRCNNKYLALVWVMKEQMNKEVSLNLNDLFRRGFQCVDEKETIGFMNLYMTNDDCISEDVHTLLGAIGNQSGSKEKSTLQIADDKKRSVVVVLKAILELGWVKDEKSKRPKSIDRAINEILRLAFGEKKDIAISQTVIPSNDINPEKSMNRIAEDLADKIKGFADEKKKKR